MASAFSPRVVPLAEMIFRTMEEDSQVVAIDLQLPAHLILVSIFEKQPAQQILLFLRQCRERVTHALSFLVGHQDGLRTGSAFIPRVMSFIERSSSALCAIDLEALVVADAIDERTETLCLVEASFLPERPEHSDKGFLLGVLDERRRPEPRPELERQERVEVLGEMALGVRVLGGQTCQILPVEFVA